MVRAEPYITMKSFFTIYSWAHKLGRRCLYSDEISGGRSHDVGGRLQVADHNNHVAGCKSQRGVGR